MNYDISLVNPGTRYNIEFGAGPPPGWTPDAPASVSLSTYLEQFQGYTTAALELHLSTRHSSFEAGSIFGPRWQSG